MARPTATQPSPSLRTSPRLPRPTSTTPSRMTPTARTQGPRHAARTALAVASVMAVKGRAPMTGYDRDLFGSAWSDDNANVFGHNGCDTRNDILRRDLEHPVVEEGTNNCVVLTGTLNDPYTGTAIHFVRGETTSTEVQIDHVVALGDAWQTGAQQWSSEKRQDFANDPLNLLAVDGSANESKGDGDAATWLPPSHAFRCSYVARQTAVKAKYALWMTQAEQAATRRILSDCSALVLPVEPGQIHPRSSFRVASAPSPPPSTSPATRHPTPPPSGQCEPGYSPCLPITSDLDCGDIDDSLKPIRVTGNDPYRLDADGDGLGCES